PPDGGRIHLSGTSRDVFPASMYHSSPERRARALIGRLIVALRMFLLALDIFLRYAACFWQRVCGQRKGKSASRTYDGGGRLLL
ncbi:hypothetical protein, partial [Pseudarthrobacter phenanthrenivorans]|uniref:hypothetical protein n=1 Tax=Pseudarthrobacter phenanthrenivorans TaxID=361575 RepID=UPI001969E5EF